MTALATNESRLIEEMYIALHLVLLLVVLNVAFPMFSMNGLSMMSIFATLYMIHVVVRIGLYVQKNIFKGDASACPGRLVTVLDGVFLSFITYLGWQAGHNLFSVFYIYVLIQGIRYQGRKPWIFALYPAFYYITYVLIEQKTTLFTLEHMINVGMLFMITWFIEIPFHQIQQLHREKSYYYDSLQEKNEELRRMATTDYLTALNNHQTFYTYFDELKFHAIRNNYPVSLTLIDIDNFKKINDTYGHLIGDKILKELAELIRASIRSTDFAARYGGEEFALIFPHTDVKNAIAISEKIRKRVENHPFEAADETIHVTVSMGTDTFKPDITYASLYDFINSVDKLLYKAKHNGKNQVQHLGKVV